MMTDLFSPIDLGAIKAKNRIIMAPLTRARSTRDSVPTPIMIEYYAQRASAGLIISEGISISPEGHGWPYAPGIWNEQQVANWKPIVKAVHDKGGKIVAQLWHVGRAGHSTINGQHPVSSSATKLPGQVHTYDGTVETEVAHALTVDGIKKVINEYVVAANNAIKAGFDGVQVNAANGYLIDQFLRDTANQRTDEYGGSVENRARFLDEVIKAVTDAVGAERTGVRLSPNGEAQGVNDSRPQELFTHVAKLLSKYNLSFIELREAGPNDTFFITSAEPKLNDLIRKYYKGPLGLNQEFNRESAIETIKSGKSDFITFGRSYIANPNLVEKFVNSETLLLPDTSTFYTQSAEGYITY